MAGRGRGRTDGELGRNGSPLAAYRFRDKEVSSSSGQSGRVISVLIGDDGKYQAVVDFGPELGSHRVPLASFAYERDHFVLREDDVRSLPSFVEGQDELRAAEPGATLSIPGYRPSATEADDSTIFVQNEAPRVTVQRPGLMINWEQAAPQVTVHQPTPHINVRQQQPIITIRQPPPRITVELDQPEIVVRMPEPEVDVDIAEPSVQVSVPKPLVQVLQAEDPHVSIRASEPLVSLLPRHQAEVAIEHGQADVRYERIGEPSVTIRQAEGGPRIRFESLVREDERRSSRDESFSTVENRLREGADRRSILAAQLEGRKIYASNDEELGVVQLVLLGDDGKLSLVITRSRLLGLTQHRIILPMSQFAMRDDRLILRSLTSPDLEAMNDWDESLERFSELPEERSIEIALWRGDSALP